MKNRWVFWFLAVCFGMGWVIAVGQAAPLPTGGCSVYLSPGLESQVKSGALKLSWSGGCANGLAEGEGVLVLQQGLKEIRRYEGPMTKGRANGKGVSIVSGFGTYKGDFVDDVAQGTGQFVLEDGSSYAGEWAGGEPKGKGMFRWANGDVYDGNWDNFTYDGRGVYVWANGNRYEGDWKEGKRSGQGAFIRADGSIYDGGWKDDRYFDAGVYTDATGRRTEWKMTANPRPNFGLIDVQQNPNESGASDMTVTKSAGRVERVINRVRAEVRQHMRKFEVRTPSGGGAVRG